jgi:hypothetical protein
MVPNSRSRLHRLGLVATCGAILGLASPAGAEELPGAEVAWEKDRLPELWLRADGPLAPKVQLEMHASVDDEATDLVGPGRTLDRVLPAVVLSAKVAHDVRVHAGAGAGPAAVTTLGCAGEIECAAHPMEGSTKLALWSTVGAELEAAGLRWLPAATLDSLAGHGVSGLVLLGVSAGG